uniref:Uncharacterized protein n=1 Tax=Bicosoecida sp. CB-2014 TaxID=1486930 RepID=A0A7S1CI34_9STRA|mmetsp:Transcript_27560/g.95308  ORF Transcript_27560/g.95308 Transcript_27560/m.95308 type:complete len:183 (+) Transcript_27560:208-756(+)
MGLATSQFLVHFLQTPESYTPQRVVVKQRGGATYTAVSSTDLDDDEASAAAAPGGARNSAGPRSSPSTLIAAKRSELVELRKRRNAGGRVGSAFDAVGPEAGRGTISWSTSAGLPARARERKLLQQPAAGTGTADASSAASDDAASASDAAGERKAATCCDARAPRKRPPLTSRPASSNWLW